MNVYWRENIFVPAVHLYATVYFMATKNLQSGIRGIVKSAGMRWTALAKLTGIRRARLSAWKNGKCELTEKELRRVAGAVDSRLLELSEARKLGPLLKGGPASQSIVERSAELRRLRQQFGISQVALAKKSGVAQFEVSLLETGLSDRLAPENIARLEKALTSLIAEQSKKLSGGPSLSNVLGGLETSEEELMNDSLYEGLRILEEGLALVKCGDGDLQQKQLWLAAELLKMRKSELSGYTAAAEITRLKAKLREVRSYYDIETQATVKHGEAEELREKVSESED
jgi:transcriptional regulator with XRE-family HTH domain